MKQVPFKALGSQTIVNVDNSCINSVILTTKTINGNYKYYWLDANVTSYDISYPLLHELSKEEYEEVTMQKVSDLGVEPDGYL